MRLLRPANDYFHLPVEAAPIANKRIRRGHSLHGSAIVVGFITSSCQDYENSSSLETPVPARLISNCLVEAHSQRPSMFQCHLETGGSGVRKSTGRCNVIRFAKSCCDGSLPRVVATVLGE
ncbi:hypothetical protein OIU85_002951 [Salix viminalis]|uniref:Uncharacterized protein n=1 Tax=Salix viminalis TaxID=40686 RepID=A0A9Q0PYT2_SALVM|nr:hypothetical protein OIU85_002951 [Salix viminalis]